MKRTPTSLLFPSSGAMFCLGVLSAFTFDDLSFLAAGFVLFILAIREDMKARPKAEGGEDDN